MPKTEIDPLLDRRNDAVAALRTVWAEVFSCDTSLKAQNATRCSASIGPATRIAESSYATVWIENFCVPSGTFLTSFRDVWNTLNNDWTDCIVYMPTATVLTEAKSAQPTEADRQFGAYLAALITTEYVTDVPTDEELAERNASRWLLE